MTDLLNTDLSGKVAVITGGGGVLCACFAKALAQRGVSVALLDLNEASVQKVADEITSGGGRAIGIKANVLDKSSLEAARETVTAKYGKVNILLNGAGGNNPRATTDDEQYQEGNAAIKDFFQLNPEDVRFVFDLNYQGTLLPTQVFARDMVGVQGACIINISSMNAYRPLTKIPAYSGAKAAVSNLTMWLATYFAKAGVRVNAIAPGFFVTNQNRHLLYDEYGKPTARTGKILKATPMGRFGEPEELIGTLLYLISPEASGFVTGIIIPVDGGFSAYSGV